MYSERGGRQRGGGGGVLVHCGLGRNSVVEENRPTCFAAVAARRAAVRTIIDDIILMTDISRFKNIFLFET